MEASMVQLFADWAFFALSRRQFSSKNGNRGRKKFLVNEILFTKCLNAAWTQESGSCHGFLATIEQQIKYDFIH